jgi:hypothetical protein
MRAGENLQCPEPHEERGEADHDECAEQRDAPRELGRQPVRLDSGLLGVDLLLPRRP